MYKRYLNIFTKREKYSNLGEIFVVFDYSPTFSSYLVCF